MAKQRLHRPWRHPNARHCRRGHHGARLCPLTVPGWRPPWQCSVCWRPPWQCSICRPRCPAPLPPTRTR
eukprot:353530-Chlamydomonas_euryale.AAC.1